MNLDERRRFVRVPCQNVLEYTLLSKSGRPQTDQYGYVHCKDVSLGGLLFASFKQLEKGTPLELKLHMECAGHRFSNVTMSGHVVRCRKAASTDTWDIAIATCPMSEEEKNLSFFNWLAEKDEEYFLL